MQADKIVPLHPGNQALCSAVSPRLDVSVIGRSLQDALYMAVASIRDDPVTTAPTRTVQGNAGPSDGDYLKTRLEVSSDIIGTTALISNVLTRRKSDALNSVSLEAVRNGVRDSQHWLLDRQEADGHWVAELEGDTILESE